ncbi:MAG: aromatic acid/H+ symport family MFS transporter [Pelistega sp.]|nr:aromatic acid/H+ symport family MFS transporter [Pelistega sp.]
MKLSIQDYINQTPFSGYQKLIFIVTFLVAFFDGYDTAVIGYIAPSLVQEWGISRPALAPVLSAALLGLACGAISSGPIADRFGRKYLLVISVALFSIGSLISAQVDTLEALERWRFITGIGLGAAMPNAVTLLSEYCPQHQRARIVNTMFCGFPLGAALGGFIASYLIPEFGWRSTLIFGGLFPLLLSVLMVFIIPESVRFLSNKSSSHAHIQTILAKFKGESLDKIDYSLQEESPAAGQGVKVVLSRHYALGSILLWVCYFMGLVIFYGVINWMPVLLGQSAMSEGAAKQIVGLFALGGVGAIASGYLMDRYNVNYLNAALALLTMLSIGMMGWSLQWGVFALVVVVLFAGVVMNTLQASLPTVAALFYPTQGRTTGVSWMMGIGRFGGVAGSYLVAELVRREFSLEQVFFCLAIPAGIMAICLLLKQYLYQQR